MSLVLTAFIPMLMGTGGNAGGQTSVTIIRGLALEEIRMRDHIDSTRDFAPLSKAEDAVAIDTSDMTIEEAKTELMQIYMSLSEGKKMALDVLMAQADEEHDGCKDCKYETYPDYYYPCCSCKQNYTDMWQKKPYEPTCDTCEYESATFNPGNACKDKSEYKPQERSEKG